MPNRPRSSDPRSAPVMSAEVAPSPLGWAEMALIALGALLVLVLTVNPIINVDLWFHLKAGELIVRNHAVPTTDPFSFTAKGAPWIVNAWLSEVIFWAIYRVWGVNGLIALESALVMGSFGLLLALWRRRGASLALGVGAMALAVVGGCWRFSPRADLISALLISATLFLLYQAKAGRDERLWLLAPIFLLWPNLHMAFPNGVMLLALFLASEGAMLLPRLPAWLGAPMARPIYRKLAILSALCVAATLANPYGYHAWLYTTSVAGAEGLRGAIEEWVPLFFDGNPVSPACLACLAALGVLFAASLILRRKLPLTSALLVLVSLLMALAFRRQALLFALAVPTALSELWAGESLRARRWLAPAVGGGVVIAIALLMSFGLKGWLNRDQLLRVGVDRAVNPVEATEFIAREVPPQKLFNTMELGGYLLWRLGPGYPISLDGRVDMYGGDRLREHIDLEARGGNWREYFRREGIDACVLKYPPTSEGLEQKLCVELSRDSDWHLVYWDDLTMVSLRDTPANAGAIARYGYRYLTPMSPAACADAIAQGKSPEVMAEIQRLLREQPRGIVAHLVVSRAYDAMGLKHEAAEERRISASLDPRRLFTTDQAASALGIGKDAARPTETAADKGLLLSRTGRYAEAIPLLQQAVKEKPRSSELRFNLAYALFQRNQMAPAEREYREAARLDPHSAEIAYNLACLLARTGRKNEALDSLHRALAQTPTLAPQAQQDPDLASLRGEKRFGEMVGRR